MVHFIYIDPTLPNNETLVKSFNEMVASGKHVFLFLFMDGCGPCNQTKPEWKKIKEILKKTYPTTVFAEINQVLFHKLRGVGREPMGYPCLRYIHGSHIEEYENSSIVEKDRTAPSFVKWVDSKVFIKQKYHRGGSKTMQRGGKWSLKYKRSINCKRPRGFSQRQHCKSKKVKGSRTSRK